MSTAYESLCTVCAWLDYFCQRSWTFFTGKSNLVTSVASWFVTFKAISVAEYH